MNLHGRSVALYGRFTPGTRARIQEDIIGRGGSVLRDLTRRSDVLVVGALATPLIDSGALGARLRLARDRGIPVRGERAFVAAIVPGEAAEAATLALDVVLSGVSRADAEILAAFDLIRIEAGLCRFGDASVLRSAAALIAQGLGLADVVRTLAAARDLAPRGRHKIIVTPAGQTALEWSDGHRTSLAGQGILPLEDEDHVTLEDLFERAALEEAAGHLEEAARLYDQCARADRSDAIAPYNLGNIQFAAGAFAAAALAYRLALARDAAFAEARYNLAQALEACGKSEDAKTELHLLLDQDPEHADAVFNLAQLEMQDGRLGAARGLFERYLLLKPPEDWALKARRAIQVCRARSSA
jgi:hypothetical protein